jgi:hypothetical protein
LIVEKAKTQSTVEKPVDKTSNSEIVENKNLTPSDVLKSARTIALHKDSINPLRQALDKELLKRKEWANLNLTITQDRTSADLSVEICCVHLSWVTNRYVFRVYDTRSGMVIAAGETNSGEFWPKTWPEILPNH